MATRIRIRRGTSSQWTAVNPLLLSGEFGYETDTGKVKIGDGTTLWNSLAYLQGSGGGTDGDSAYQVAVNNGFIGTEQEWLASLHGTDGIDGTNGTNGIDGDSAYEVAVENGFVGTEAEWLESLKPLTYIDGNIFQGDGETVETKFTVKDYGIEEIKLSEALQSKINSYSISERESNTVLFDHDYIIGNAAARTGNILFSFTGAKIGASTMMIHQDSAAFTLPAESVILSGSVSGSVTNYIYFLLTDITAGFEKVHVTISQEVV